jgi:hypothetical protein
MNDDEWRRFRTCQLWVESKIGAIHMARQILQADIGDEDEGKSHAQHDMGIFAFGLNSLTDIHGKTSDVEAEARGETRRLLVAAPH